MVGCDAAVHVRVQGRAAAIEVHDKIAHLADQIHVVRDQNDAGLLQTLGENIAALRFEVRITHGEDFAYRQVRLDIDVCCAGKLMARERALVRPDPALRQAQFGDFSHTAGMYVLGQGEPPTPESEDSVRVGVSELAHGGWYVRALANRAADLEASLGRLHARWWCT